MINKDKIKLNILMIWAILIIISLLVFIGFISYLLINSKQGFDNFNFNTYFNSSVLNKLLMFIPICSYAFFDLLSCIMIWTIKWQTKWIKKSKAIFGVLSLILPFVFIFVFVNLSKLKMKDEIIDQLKKEMNYLSSPFSYPVNFQNNYSYNPTGNYNNAIMPQNFNNPDTNSFRT